MPTSSSRSNTPRKRAGKRDFETAAPETLRLGDEAGKKDRETAAPEALRLGGEGGKKDGEAAAPEALGLGEQAEKRGRGKVERRKKKKAVDEKPLEDVSMTKGQKMELWTWLRKEMTDPNFIPVDPMKLNHAFLKFSAQLMITLNLKPAQMEEYTGMKPSHQHKLRPHVNHLDDVQVALTSLIKWLNGLHLNPARVLEWLMKQMMAVLMPFSELAA